MLTNHWGRAISGFSRSFILINRPRTASRIRQLNWLSNQVQHCGHIQLIDNHWATDTQLEEPNWPYSNRYLSGERWLRLRNDILHDKRSAALWVEMLAPVHWFNWWSINSKELARCQPGGWYTNLSNPRNFFLVEPNLHDHLYKPYWLSCLQPWFTSLLRKTPFPQSCVNVLNLRLRNRNSLNASRVISRKSGLWFATRNVNFGRVLHWLSMCARTWTSAENQDTSLVREQWIIPSLLGNVLVNVDTHVLLIGKNHGLLCILHRA